MEPFITIQILTVNSRRIAHWVTPFCTVFSCRFEIACFKATHDRDLQAAEMWLNHSLPNLPLIEPNCIQPHFMPVNMPPVTSKSCRIPKMYDIQLLQFYANQGCVVGLVFQVWVGFLDLEAPLIAGMEQFITTQAKPIISR